MFREISVTLYLTLIATPHQLSVLWEICYTGLEQSLEVLKKNGNVQKKKNFPNLEKVWKVRINSGKIEK